MPVDPTLVDLAETLVRVDSTNPDLGTGGVGESAVAGVVADWLRGAGLEVTVEQIAPGRPNVIGVARGSGGGRSLLLNAHLDTVGAGGMVTPFDPVVRDGRLHGRGAADMKGSLAAVMLAAARAALEDLRGDVIVAAVVDEEVGSLGTEALVRSWTADAAIVAEPTDEVVAVAHKGFVQFEVETAGVAAHGSRPDLGVDAIAAMGPVLTGISALAKRLSEGPAHALFGPGSVHASLIEGGQEYSSYPTRCLLVGERRTIPGETPEQVRAEIEALAGGAVVRVPFHREPFETAADADVVVGMLAHLGRGPTEVGGVPFWADSALLAGAGIPTVVFGPIGHGLHGDDEWVDLASLQRCHDAYLAVARMICA